MELNLTTAAGRASKSTVTVADEVFARDFNEPLIHQVVVAYMAAARAGTKKQKTRSEVSGGGIKPWKQKGSGRARAGSIRSPLWRTGGKIFAAVPRNYEQKVNRKMYRAALQSIISELVRQQRLVVVEGISVDEPKTRLLVEQLGKFDAGNVLIVTDGASDNLFLAARNLHQVEVCEAGDVNPLRLIGHDKVLITVGAVKKIEEMLS
ncbi:MAG: 50S ribosomal protein L4 [Gammaproteobacteria bacterium]|nr:50S ribosomal protein L4 [Gammaproteobacteria bacterium]